MRSIAGPLVWEHLVAAKGNARASGGFIEAEMAALVRRVGVRAASGLRVLMPPVFVVLHAVHLARGRVHHSQHGGAAGAEEADDE